MENTKRTIDSFRNQLIYIACALIVLGVLLVAFPGISALIICYIIGAVLCVLGLIRIVGYFRIERDFAFASFGLVRGGVLLLLGILVLVRPQLLSALLTVVFGIVLFVDGVLKIQYAIDMLRLRASGWWLVLVCALLMCVLGIVALCDPFATALALMTFIGISLIVDGIMDLATIIYLSSFLRRNNKFIDTSSQM